MSLLRKAERGPTVAQLLNEHQSITCHSIAMLVFLGKFTQGEKCSGPAMSDLNMRARGLLEFVTQRVEEGLADPSTMAECFSEADQALRILGKTVRKEDEFRYAQLALLGIFDISFARIVEDEPAERTRWSKERLEKVVFAKTLFP
jgi:hypothetical protein